MTLSMQIQTLIASSYMLHLIGELDFKEKSKRSSVDLVTWLLRKQSKPKNFSEKELDAIIVLAEKAYSEAKDALVDKKLTVAIATVVETLYFNHQEGMDELHGQELVNRVGRFVEKQSYDNISDYAKDSYVASQALLDSIRKNVYEYLKGRE